jgi:Lar family restriction alleviation protein
MSDDLKPCPFCGGNAKRYYRADDSGWENTYWVGCTDGCGASTACYETKALAVTVWNTRIDTDDMADRIEELEAENKRLKSMIADVIHSTGDDPEIMAASRAEWAARALEAEAKLVDVTEEFDAIVKHDRTRIEELVSMVVGRDNRIEELEAKLAKEIEISNQRGNHIEFVLLPQMSDLHFQLKDLQAKLAKAMLALDEAIYLLDPDDEDIAKETGLHRIVTTYAELKEEKNE